MRTVIIIAPPGDAHALVVAKRIESLGAVAVLLDSAEYPNRWRLSVSLANDSVPGFVLETEGIEVRESDLAGVWWRRPRRYAPSEQVVEEHLRRFVTQEAREAFEGWLLSLGRKVMNSPSAEAAARKLVQLKLARELGLTIPKSLITNSPPLAQAFYESTGPGTVFKPFTGVSWNMLSTRRLTPDTLGHLSAVAHSPVVFQEEIEKVADIRVNVVDSQVFALRISSKHPEAPIDWRVEVDSEYAEHSLPQPVRESLLALTARLGLRFAACDLALTPEGGYVFFEANPGGQWLFAEIYAGQPISEAIARALLSGGERA